MFQKRSIIRTAKKGRDENPSILAVQWHAAQWARYPPGFSYWFGTDQPQIATVAGCLSLGEVTQQQLRMERGEDLVQP